jgi:ABC-type multidrug transport system ATPase subunit
VIRLCAVEKRYGGKVALAPLDLAVDAGRIVGLVGANGAGKSTALSIASGQVVPDAGRVELGGKDLAADPIAARRALSYVPQESPLPHALTVDEVFAFFAEVRGVPIDQTAPLVALSGLEADRTALVRELSGGMRRKLALATALLPGPVSIVLDEPFAGLDELAERRFEAAIRARRGAGAAVLVAGHDLDRIVALADEIVVLSHGQVARRAKAGEVDGAALRALLD